MSVCSFSLATNRSYNDKQGQKQTQTEFRNIVAWGKQGETIAQWMKKGSLILVEGRLQTRSWQDKQGAKRYTTEIVLEGFQFGPKREASAPAPGEKLSQEFINDIDRHYPSATPATPAEEIDINDIPL